MAASGFRLQGFSGVWCFFVGSRVSSRVSFVCSAFSPIVSVDTLVSLCASRSLRATSGGCVGVPACFDVSGCLCVFVRPRVSVRVRRCLLPLQGVPGLCWGSCRRWVCWWVRVCLLCLRGSTCVSVGLRQRLCLSLGLCVSTSVRVRVRVFPRVVARLSTCSRAFVFLRSSSRAHADLPRGFWVCLCVCASG